MILEWIHQVPVNLVHTNNIKETYVNKDDPWLNILSAAAFTVRSTANRLKVYSTVQLIFGPDMISLIKCTANWGLIHQRKHTHVNKDNIHANSEELTTTRNSDIK